MKELALNHLPELAPRTVESLNLLRLRLEQTAPDAKIILLTSTTPQEGKTTLALQFWQLLAGLGQRCLLVDGDLRHSGICRQCGHLPGSGLRHHQPPGPAAGTPPFCPHGGKLCTKVCLSFGRCSSPERMQ